MAGLTIEATSPAYMIWNSWQVLNVEAMYVGLLVIAILGFLFSLALDEIERMLIAWKARA